MHEIHDGSDFRLRDGYGISHTSVGQRLMFVFSWAHCDSIGGWFSLALTLGELSQEAETIELPKDILLSKPKKLFFH